MSSEREPKLVIIQTINRRNETPKMRAVLTNRLAPRFLKDPRVQELIGREANKTSEDSLGSVSVHVIGVIIERGRRPRKVIPLTVSNIFIPIP